jgi:paired amphipathic helix protein Sin3a
VYNAGVERQFFDAVKAALTSFSRDGQAYAEFIKTLDMYAQEILSRNDMLGYVERLLGKNRDLFEEFKRIIAAIGAPDAPAHDDSWHSVPLSEIDFSRCRRCSPSYRALPRDYPNPPCSERSEEELKVLNDVWVSLPVGSEESYTFRHMRKNQYEETLFRCEDMRFEIDMCIDGNASTMQRLSAIYDELQVLSENELLAKGSISKKCPDGAGLGGKIFQYTLDGRVLGVIHKHTIRRIYGEDGVEMLELCFKNPAVAIPIVVSRLRQKDKEWRAARDALNRKWKDLAEYNYYYSLDHRSITWRTTDKRATSTRTLVAEIKDRAAHDGLEGEAALNAKKEKAKEEHGSFYETTMGSTLPKKMDLTYLPKPTKTLFTPHMSFIYNGDSWAQQDAYRIISFGLERGSASPGDKERCYRLWRDFIAPWFGLELSWMQSPAVKFVPTITPEEIEDDIEDASAAENNTSNGGLVKEEVMKPVYTSENKGYFAVEGHVPFPPDTVVSTTLGEAKVIKYNKEDGIYDLSFPSGTKLLPPDAVFCSIYPVETSLLTDQLRSNDQEVLERSDDRLMIGTQPLYLFVRLHQILVRRLNIAKSLSTEVCKDTALGRHIEKLTFEGDPDEGKKRYDAFLSLIFSLLDAGNGSSETSEGGKYEDRVRCLLGNQSYELTTMDKLISHILKSLQHMANDDTLQNMIEIYQRHTRAGSFKPSAFREEAALLSEGENMYAFQLCSVPNEDQKITHCEFLGCIAEDDDDEDETPEDGEDNKRGIDEVTEDADDSGELSSKRPREAFD